ncbi:MAG: hypothetical protein AAFU85_24115 [Planctomycetota bacterium]
MKRRLLLGFTILFIASVAIARSDVGWYSEFWGRRLIANVPEQQLINTPAWNRKRGEPAVGPGLALRLAQPAFERVKVDRENHTWMLSSLDLIPADAGSPDEEVTRDRWYWVAKYMHYPENGRGSSPTIRIVVLMDGTVVAPTVDGKGETTGP